MNLPKGDKLVGELSGGTQRRMSIVVALINNPRLVILDEPTVGIDAVLRNQIWDYLVAKKNEGMTIIIVTHYIEEAANSDRVGLMRNGRLLAEDNPKALMARYQEPNLEAVFLKLCCIEDAGYDMDNDMVKEVPPPAAPTAPTAVVTAAPEYLAYGHYALPTATAVTNGTNGTGKIDPNNNQLYTLSPAYHNFPPPHPAAHFALGMPHPFALPALVPTLKPTLVIKFWILLTLIYKNFVKFFYSYFSLIIILLPAIQAVIYSAAVSKNVIEVSRW